MRYKHLITSVPDFPKPGIMFRDISPLLASPNAMMEVTELFATDWDGKVDAVVGLDARGFIFGSYIAHELMLPFVMIRKRGKLPGDTRQVSYKLEYSEGDLEIPCLDCLKQAKVLVVDDVLATGGTAAGAATLVKAVGGLVAGYAFVIELMYLEGRKHLTAPIQSLVRYESEQS